MQTEDILGELLLMGADQQQDNTNLAFFAKTVEFNTNPMTGFPGICTERESGEYTIITNGCSEGTCFFEGLDDNMKPLGGLQYITWGCKANGKFLLEFIKVRIENNEAFYDRFIVKDAVVVIIDTRVLTEHYTKLLERAQIGAFPKLAD